MSKRSGKSGERSNFSSLPGTAYQPLRKGWRSTMIESTRRKSLGSTWARSYRQDLVTKSGTGTTPPTVTSRALMRTIREISRCQMLERVEVMRLSKNSSRGWGSGASGAATEDSDVARLSLASIRSVSLATTNSARLIRPLIRSKRICAASRSSKSNRSRERQPEEHSCLITLTRRQYTMMK